MLGKCVVPILGMDWSIWVSEIGFVPDIEIMEHVGVGN